MNTRPQYKEILVPPLAAGREILGLLLVLCLIFLGAGLRFIQLAPTKTKAEVQSYQILDIRLQDQAPVLYRSLLTAAESIIWDWEMTGSWPPISQLQQNRVPPFAEHFLPKALQGFHWEQHSGPSWVDYYGINRNVATAKEAGTDPLSTSFILRLIDLKAGEYPYPAVQQEGPLSVQIWINPQSVDYPQGSLMERGWKWIVSNFQIQQQNIQ
jgi:hypothetical protein